MYKKLFSYKRSPIIFLKDLAKSMNQNQNAKTIVFACKIYNYGLRIILAKNIAFPKNIPMPIDSRIIKNYQTIT